MKSKRGFTILELLVVVAILALIAVIAVPQFIGAIDKSKDSRYLAELNSVEKALSTYYMDHGSYPTLQGNQPTLGDPKNIRFGKDRVGNEGLYPKYLASLPHFSYWYVDNEGKTYHTKSSVESKISAGEYKVIPDKKGIQLKVPTDIKEKYPAVLDGFEGSKLHPESPEATANKPPIPTIIMTPDAGIMTNTTISWDYSFKDPNGDSIQKAEWEGKQEVYATAGTYTVKLRLQDSKGLWSNWVEKTFDVLNASGVKQLTSGYNEPVVLMNNGTVKVLGVTNKTVPGLTDVKQVAATNNYAIALLSDGTVKSFNSSGIVNTVNVTGIKFIATGYQVGSVGITEDGKVKFWTNGTVNAIDVTSITNAVSVAVGDRHVAVVTANGTVKSWGYNGTSQLGISGNSNNNRTYDNPSEVIIPGKSVKQVSAGYSHTLAVMEDGTVYVWGGSAYGQSGLGVYEGQYVPTMLPGITNATQVAAGYWHSLALLNTGEIMTWGYDPYGQLGDGVKPTYRVTPQVISGVSNCVQVSGGYLHSQILMKDGTVMSFGYNANGQLGDGTTTESLVPKAINLN